MRHAKLALLAALLALAQTSAAGERLVVVSGGAGPATGEAVPVAVAFDQATPSGDNADPARLRLVEITTGNASPTSPLPVQFEPDAPGSSHGQLWWLLPPSQTRERRFRLIEVAKPAPAEMNVQADATKSYYDIGEGAQPVLRYNQGTVPVPAGIPTNYARGDYLMPLFGPGGELLTADYPPDHPHHRGIGWSWPVTRWGDEVRDIWAVVGVWARPVAMRRVEVGPVFALLDAENVWKWGDTNPIVREEVLIRAFRQTGGDRFVDVEVRLTALAERVAIGGRPHGGYGGFGLRAQPAQQRVITAFVDPPAAVPRRSWLDYSGVFAGGKGPAGLAIFESVNNPLYPSELKIYPELNYVMPAFPGEREVPLSCEKPLVLRHRLWIHTGMASESRLAEVWSGYANPPRAKLVEQ